MALATTAGNAERMLKQKWKIRVEKYLRGYIFHLQVGVFLVFFKFLVKFLLIVSLQNLNLQ